MERAVGRGPLHVGRVPIQSICIQGTGTGPTWDQQNAKKSEVRQRIRPPTPKKKVVFRTELAASNCYIAPTLQISKNFFTFT